MTDFDECEDQNIFTEGFDSEFDGEVTDQITIEEVHHPTENEQALRSLSRVQIENLRNGQVTNLNLKEWSKQIWYWRTHLDVFIEDYFEIKLKDVQKVEARIIGNRVIMQFVQSRGFGKTWLTAICCIALGVLYPGSLIAVISGSAEQATLVLQKIKDYFVRNENVLREIETGRHAPVILNRSKGVCRLWNGSKIESYSIGLFRGQRAKILIIDEAPEVNKTDLDAIAEPVTNYTREITQQNDPPFPDYDSKIISITSACLKNNYFYELFMSSLRRMCGREEDQHGVPDDTVFACALDYNAAARVGITKREFFDRQKRKLSKEKFDMEYGSIFVGDEHGTVFPYDLTNKCRTCTDIEWRQPHGSMSEYVIGVDLATSMSKNADNASLCVVKLLDGEDGIYTKRLVCLQTFHGEKLDELAEELRKLLVRFPNCSKVVFDHNGLGDAFPQFLSKPWVDPETQKEYPPLVLDTDASRIPNAVPLLRPFRANPTLNQQMVTYLTVALEQHSLELPISSKKLFEGRVTLTDEEVLREQETGEEIKKRVYTKQERAIFVEADALQIEMGQIVAKVSGSGAIMYDSAKATQHKDRYSALGMAIHYISGIEEYQQSRLRRRHAHSGGVVLSFD